MRTLWLQLGGTEHVRMQMQIPRLNYPLCFNVPRSAWISEKSSVDLFQQTSNPGFFLDLIVELRDTLNKVDSAKARLSIKGYRWCVGVSDKSFIETVACPSIRDRVTCFYYSRFPDGYNAISQVIAENWEQILKEQSVLELGGLQSVLETQFDHNPEDILAFLSQFTTLNAGDLVSVGSAWYLEEMDEKISDLSVTFGTIKWCVEIHRGMHQ